MELLKLILQIVGIQKNQQKIIIDFNYIKKRNE